MEYPKGLKWTRQRKDVYSVLFEAKEPLSVVQIYDLVEKHSDETYALSTVYRIMQAFEEQHLIQKTTWPGDGTVVYELASKEHTHYAVCLDCHRRIPLEHCPFNHVVLEEVTEDFTITAHKLEVYGYCRNCKKLHK